MKWLSWLAKMAVAAIFLTVISLYATWTVVHTYLDKVLAHYQIGGDMEKVGFSDFLENVGQDMNIMNQPASPKDQPVNGKGLAAADIPAAGKGTDSGSNAGTGGSADPAGINGAGSGANPGAKPGNNGGGTEGGAGGSLSGKEEKDGAAGGKSRDSEGMADALPVFGQSGGGRQDSQVSGTQSGEQDKKTVVSADNLTSTKDKMSNEDKMKLFSLLVSKLPPSEVQNISKLMEDGITQKELEELDSIVKKYMTTDEYNQMVVILEKYQ